MLRQLPNMLTWLRMAASPALYATLWLNNELGPWIAAALRSSWSWIAPPNGHG